MKRTHGSKKKSKPAAGDSGARRSSGASKPARRPSRKRGTREIGGIRMLEPTALDKSSFAPLADSLRTELLSIQYELRDAGVPVVLMLAGSDRRSILEVVNRLTEWFDARVLEIVARGEATESERARPYFWRFASRLPAGGKIGIFPFGWAHDLLVSHLDRKRSKRGRLAESHRAPSAADVFAFERTLADAGTLVIKVWFHLDDDELEERRDKDQDDPLAAWDPDRDAAKRWRKLEHDDAAESTVLRATHFACAPWHVLHATDDEARDLAVGRLLRDVIRRRLAAGHQPPVTARPRLRIPDHIGSLPALPAVDRERYETRMKELQGRLNQLARKAYRHGVSTVLVFEGPDAAGKGGAVRRITKAIRAPIFQVVPIAAPTEEERSHHWLWRFWRALPADGQITIFDRSWYGRVLVERVESFAVEAEWERAYREIREFEDSVTQNGGLLLKFWIEVGEEEQARRFDARGTVPFKKYKLTPDDFRNRAKRPAYRDAANEMIFRTQSRTAPWRVIPGDDKSAARIAILSTVVRELERALGRAKR